MKPISSEPKLNYWHLACIMGSAQGLPVMIVGGQLAKQFGAGISLTSIIIGNCILWLIGLGIISMAEGKNHAIENVRAYLGKYTGVIAALVWVCSFLIWYAIQVQVASGAIGHFFQPFNDWKMGLALGLLVALISIGSIRMIKWVSVILLPVLVIFALVAILVSGLSITFKDSWGFSFPAIMTVMFLWMPGSVNLPTLMRFARSRGDAVLGLSLKVVFLIFFQVFTIFVEMASPLTFLLKFSPINAFANEIATILFIIMSYICVNLLNIYFSSAAWETITRKEKGSLRYFFIGVLGTLGFFIIQRFNDIHLFSYSLVFIATMLTSFMLNLGIILLLDFLAKMLVGHRPKSIEKTWSSVCWIFGCIVTITTQLQEPTISISNVLLIGIVGSMIAFLIYTFISETVWSIRKLLREN